MLSDGLLLPHAHMRERDREREREENQRVEREREKKTRKKQREGGRRETGWRGLELRNKGYRDRKLHRNKIEIHAGTAGTMSLNRPGSSVRVSFS